MKLYQNLPNYLADKIECHIFDSIDSTSDYLQRLPASPQPQICISAEQTHGKGQYKRQWLNVKNGSISLSIRYNFATKTPLDGLSLIVGLAVIEVLAVHYGLTKLKLKWPNDVYYKKQKIAGILLQNKTQDKRQSVIMGLGLNYDLGTDFKCPTLWIDLAQLLPILPDIVELSAKLIEQILQYCAIFATKGLGYFKEQWQCYDYLQGKNMRYKHYNGVCVGISQQGALLLQTDNEIKEIYSSEGLVLLT